MNIAILGQGAWGTALAFHVSQAHAVRWWGRDPARCQALAGTRLNEAALPGCVIPDSIQITEDIQACVEGCDWVVMAVPVAATAEVAAQLGPVSRFGLIWTCKGMDPDSGRLPGEILDDVLGPGTRRAVLSGPSFADDLAAGLPAAAVMAAADPEVAEAAATVFHHGPFRIYPGTDPVGVQLGGAVKNVLAIAAGIAHGLRLGDSARAALITRGINEMMVLGKALGANQSTLSGLSGLGDLVLTCSSAHSRNFRLGQLIGEGQSVEQAGTTIGQVTEGRHTALALSRLSQDHGLELPICEQVRQVLAGTIRPAQAVEALLTRPARFEVLHA